ncbi:hypothetical protein BC941DRAFT_348088 [Chlamydoabsidia padenii]|nr:hypothetical protein BC941DRAFT_348088 [Chlamydoabsidia padenii]
MNGVELAHYEHCSDPHALEFVGFRNELAMLSVTTGLIQSRVFAMKNDQLNRVNPTWWQKYALIYRDGQENLYNHTLDLIQARKLQVLKAMKKELNNNNCASTAPFINILNPSHYQLSLNGDEINSNNDTIFVPLEDVTISLKRLLANDKEFKDVIDQLFEDIEEEEDVVFMLALIHESTKRDSAWAPFIRATRMDRAEQRDEETMMDLQGLYESLFPAFSDAFPSVFDPAIYTPDNFLWAENVISNYTIDNPLVVVPL